MNAVPSTPKDLAVLHAACFTRPRPWTAAEFASLLAARGTTLIAVEGGVLLARQVAGEAELLTLAVAPAHRRHGIARQLMLRFLETSGAAGVTEAFLEVASDNGAARALYDSTGWKIAGRRRDYYAAGVDAVVMRRAITGDSGGRER